MAYKATLVGAGSNAPTLSKEQIQELVDARSEAKAARDFGKADKLRLQLARSCVQIDDAPSGVDAYGGLVWHGRPGASVPKAQGSLPRGVTHCTYGVCVPASGVLCLPRTVAPQAASAWTCQINGMSGRVQQAVVSRQPRDEEASATTEAEKRRLKNKKKREGKEKKAAALASEGGGGGGGSKSGEGGGGGGGSGEGGGKSGEGTTQAVGQAAGQAAAGVEGEVVSDQGAKRAKTEQ